MAHVENITAPASEKAIGGAEYPQQIDTEGSNTNSDVNRSTNSTTAPKP